MFILGTGNTAVKETSHQKNIGSLSVIPGPVAWASVGNILEMQNPGLFPNMLQHQLLGGRGCGGMCESVCMCELELVLLSFPGDSDTG